MKHSVRSIRKLIALVVIAGALLAAIFALRRGEKTSPGSVESAEVTSQDTTPEDVADEVARNEPELQSEPATETAEAADLMDETDAPAKTDDPNYKKHIAEFREAFAASEPCRYIKVINKLASPSIVEVFASEPAGQAASSSNTGLLNRLYSQGAFAAKPVKNPVVSTKTEEFLMALRYAGLLEGVKRAELDYAKSESQLRKIAAREPDNGAPLFFLSDVLASQKKDGRALMREIFATTRFDTYRDEIVYSIDRQSEGSPDHYLIGNLLLYSVPAPEFTAPLARMRVWIEDGDEDTARSALAWAEPLADAAFRSSQTLSAKARGLKSLEFSTFKSLANAARKRLKLPLDERPIADAFPKDALGEHMWDAFEDLEGKKYDDDRSAALKPCDRRTMDRQYQKFLTREWRKDRR